MEPIKIFCLAFALVFITGACKKKEPEPTRQPVAELEQKQDKPTKPVELARLLHQAAAQGDIEQVQSHISQRVDVNAKDQQGRTPFSLAKQKANKEIVGLLRNYGAKE